jgi:ATP-dependent exoDNAse (exonuclease V) alpha subunit
MDTYSLRELRIGDAEDTVSVDRQPTNMEQKMAVTGMTLDQTKKLMHRIEFAIGMQVMVTLNIATEANLANGSRGIIQDIILDPREELIETDRDEEGVVWLPYPPAMILFKPFHHEFEPFPGYEPGLILIFPSEVTFNIFYGQNSKTKVNQRQYPICAGYAFTDHKAQGQTLEYVYMDIGTTNKFPVTLFATYVALSHSRGRDTIRLLRDFDNTIFTRHPSEDLQKEDERLRWLSKNTTDRYETGYYTFK